MALKAYIVTEGPFATIVFAGNKRKAVDTYYEKGFEPQGMYEIEVIRKIELDRFAELEKVPPYYLVQSGFILKCNGCREQFMPQFPESDYYEFDDGLFCYSCTESIKCGSCGHPDSDEFCPDCGGNFKNWLKKSPPKES